MSRKRSINLLAIVFACVLVCGNVTLVAADTQSDLNAAIQQRDETATQLYTVQDRIAILESKKGEAMAYLSELNDQLADLNEELVDLQYRYKEKQLELDIVNQELLEALLEEETQRGEMGARIRYMYENTRDAGILESIFSAQSFTDFLNRAENFNALTEYDRKMLDEYREIYREVKEKRFQVLAEKKEVALLESQTEAKKAEIKELYDLTADDISAYSAEITEEQAEQSIILSELQAREAEINRLTTKIAEEIAAAEAAARAEAERLAAASNGGGQSYTVVQDNTQGQGYETSPESTAFVGNSNWGGTVLNRTNGSITGPNGRETYYNLDMSGVVQIMRNMGNNDKYWVRSDGCKMLGDYIICAANLGVHPRGSIVESSLGPCIVCDTGGFAAHNPNQLDIATNW